MTPPAPIQYGGAALDLSPRLFKNATVVASPTGSTETIVCSLTIDGDLAVMEGIWIAAFGAYTVGTNGVSVNLKIRRTDASGSTLAATGAVTRVAAALDSGALQVFDTGPTLPNQVYVLTATVASGAAASTFSAASLIALVI